MLDFRIETFLCVCKHKSYTLAAKELCITQPNVTQHIKYLENHYHQTLFTYDHKSLQLTQAGMILEEAMNTIKNDIIKLESQLQLHTNRIESINVGATLSIGEFLLPYYIVSYMKKNPHMNIDLKIYNTHKLLEELDQGMIDCAFIEGNIDKSKYCFNTFREEQFIIVKAGQPLQVSHISELFDYPLLVREKGSGTREILEGYLKQVGYSINNFPNVIEVNNAHSILALLKQDYGISFMYEMVAKDELDHQHLSTITLDHFNIKHELNFVWRKNSIYDIQYKQFLDSLNIIK